jgi:hypothetical protein
MKTRFLLPMLALGAITTSANALVSLEFRPLNQSVFVGDTVSIGLYATAPTPESFVAVDTILIWTNSIMNPVGSNQFGGAYNAWTSAGFLNNEMNQSLSDGDAFWTGLGPLFGTPPEGTPGGSLLTTFTFTALTPGTATLAMPASFNWPGRPQPFESKVYGPQNQDITGTLAATATVTVNAVPEPASMAVLGLGALALLRRRRR